MLVKSKFIYTFKKDFNKIFEEFESQLGSNYVDLWSSEIDSKEIRIDVSNLNKRQKEILFGMIKEISTVNIEKIQNIINDIDYIVIFN